MNNIKDLPVNDRPYEKCFAKGPEYLTDVELLCSNFENRNKWHQFI